MKYSAITLVLVGGLAAMVLAAPSSDLPTAAEDAKQDKGLITAKEALQRLIDGNARFACGEPCHPHEEIDWREHLEKEQHPFAAVLGCSDSRVPPELIFDQGIGDLFVIRVAGNVVETDVCASVEYAIDHLDTRLILVMGHTNCGAVVATVDHLEDTDQEPAEVVSLLFRIEPAVSDIPTDLPRKDRINLAVRRNVKQAVRRLSIVPDLRKRIKAGTVKLVGAVYDMHTGKVEVLEQEGSRREGREANR